jgi:hypothetical protein
MAFRAHRARWTELPAYDQARHGDAENALFASGLSLWWRLVELRANSCTHQGCALCAPHDKTGITPGRIAPQSDPMQRKGSDGHDS